MTSKGQVNETSVHVNRDNKRKQCLGERSGRHVYTTAFM